MSVLKLSLAAAAACVCLPVLADGSVQLPGPGSSYVTPAAASELASLCATGTGYPSSSLWTIWVHPSPVSAISGQPKIEQYRNGKLVATYTSFSNQPTCQLSGTHADGDTPSTPAATGCGPFTRSHTTALWRAGDTFLVYPAVYSGGYNQPYVGEEYRDWSDAAPITPDNVVIQGVVQNNQRPVILLTGGASDNTLGQAPVYFDRSTGFHMDSINVVAGPGAVVGKAGVYNIGGSNLTLSNMRISNFAINGANGLFGAGNYSGSLTLQGVELDHNGGTNGPTHNAYIGPSLIDPGYTVNVTHSWSHDAYYGHLFKSRAQVNVFTANFFQGGLPTAGNSQAEAYLLDVPNGGRLTARNNIFVKTLSGLDSNGMSITFGLEGFTDGRRQGIDIENNTFITFAKWFDGSHLTYPLAFLTPAARPDAPNWPGSIPVRVMKNAFVGYCPAGNGAPSDYHGDLSLTESFGETAKNFRFTTDVFVDESSMANLVPNYQPTIGSPAFDVNLQLTITRQKATLGAEDALVPYNQTY